MTRQKRRDSPGTRALDIELPCPEPPPSPTPEWRTERRVWEPDGDTWTRSAWESVARGEEGACRAALTKAASAVDGRMIDLRLWCGLNIVLHITR